MKILAPSLLAAALLAPSLTQAHDMWLLPSSTVLSGDQAVITVDAAVGNDKFYFNHHPLSLNNLEITSPSGKRVQAENKFSGKLRSGFDLPLTEDGTYRIAIATPGGLFARWKEGGQNKRWFGNAKDYAQHVPKDAKDLVVAERSNRVETFVTKGNPTDLPAVEQGLGLASDTHPNDLYAGEETQFTLTLDGQPAKQVDVEVVREGSRYRNALEEIKVKTDDKGVFKIKWPQAGRYWLHAQTSDKKTSTPLAKQRGLAYTATLEVLPQ